MLNLGFIYGGAFGSASGWMYGTLQGPFVSETVHALSSIVNFVAHTDPSTYLTDNAILTVFGMFIGACAGSLYSGRTAD